LALQLIEQISVDRYDPEEFKDEEKQRILAAIDEKIAGKEVVVSEEPEARPGGGQVIDLMEALRASLSDKKPAAKKAAAPAPAPKEKPPRKSARRAAAPAPEDAPARARARK